MTWTSEDAAKAASMGYGVFTVIDVTGGRVTKPHLQILPAQGFSKEMPTAAHFLGYVRRLAMSDVTARRAVELTVQRGAPPWGK